MSTPALQSTSSAMSPEGWQTVLATTSWRMLVDVAEMQALERAADAAGHSYAAMMERAGQQVAAAILARWGALSTLVLAGPGNNGGDGLVCARYLHEAGAPVRVYLWKRRTDPAHDYQGHCARLVAAGIPVAHADEDPDGEQLHAWLDCAVVVDALLGTGANRPIEGQLAEILAAVTAMRREHGTLPHLVAVDCSSGLNCDNGAVTPGQLAADLTVTFGHAKLGHYLFPGAALNGELLVVDIGIAPALSAGLRTFVLDGGLVAEWLPTRADVSHKGSFGKVMVAGGCSHFPGAVALSCSAAGRVGAGLVTGAVPRAVWAALAGRVWEPTWLPQGGADEDFLAPAAAAPVAAALAGYDALVLGCGLGNAVLTRDFLAALLAHPLPATVVDADGLNVLAQLPAWSERLPARCVLTPHPAEMARLCGLPVAEVAAQRWALARRMAVAWRCVVLLKGPYTVVAEPGGWLAVLPVATPALATAGTGDVLAGAIGGLLAQGMEPFLAACAGAWVHGQAGLRCQRTIGRAGVAAGDLLPQLPAVLAELQAQPAAG